MLSIFIIPGNYDKPTTILNESAMVSIATEGKRRKVVEVSLDVVPG
jgi:hypothetical protein